MHAPIPGWLDARLVGALERRGISALYSHQAEALEALRAGQDVAIVTPTASGKSLCYNLPVLQAIAEDPAARALYLFPTKALSQDQLAEFRDLAGLAGMDLSAAVYDGDTPAPIRAVVREAGQVVVTNPDMLSTAILPHHTKWFQLFEQVRYIVIDEAHTYRGIFGSHVANVLRRLLRICAHYGSAPRLVCCSATIGNPGQLAETLTGRPFRVIDRSGAPQGERHVVVLDPAPLDRRTGVRPGPHGLSYRAALTFLRAGRQTIVFGRARVAVELLLTSLREAMREGRGPIERVRGYRSGYLPSERRAIESGLRSGEILGVVSTNALELGIDIGRLDVAILAGYPGTIAATWQQMGRAGRRGEPSVAILVAGAGALDRYVATHPEYLFEATPGGGAPGPGEHPRAAGPPAGGDLRAALRPGRALRQRPGGRPAGLPGGGGPRAPGGRRALVLGQRELPGLGDRPARGCAGERAHHRHRARAPAGPRRGGPLRGARARPREGHLPPRVAPVPRGRARLGGAQGARATRRHRLLHAGGAGRDAQAARGLRQRPSPGRQPPARRGHDQHHRHHLQEAQAGHARERRLGPHPPAGDGAAHDGLVAGAGPGCRGGLAAR